jgi:hypothetical protein
MSAPIADRTSRRITLVLAAIPFAVIAFADLVLGVVR